MIIRSRKKAGAELTIKKQETIGLNSIKHKGEKMQPKKLEDKLPKVEVKSEIKTESQVEIKEEKIIDTPKKKRSLLEEVLEEQINFED